jgi:hypothetical protein
LLTLKRKGILKERNKYRGEKGVSKGKLMAGEETKRKTMGGKWYEGRKEGRYVGDRWMGGKGGKKKSRYELLCLEGEKES